MPEKPMMEDIFSEYVDLGDGNHLDVFQDDETKGGTEPDDLGGEQLSPEDTAHLVAAMARLAAQGDHAGVAKLAQLAKEPEKLHQIIGEMNWRIPKLKQLMLDIPEFISNMNRRIILMRQFMSNND